MIVHIHGNLGGADHRAISGHIFGGKVNGLAEITILKLETLELYRELNEKTGLKELHIR
jgi:predicted DNA-binding protein with PD1-like motif